MPRNGQVFRWRFGAEVEKKSCAAFRNSFDLLEPIGWVSRRRIKPRDGLLAVPGVGEMCGDSGRKAMAGAQRLNDAYLLDKLFLDGKIA
jgi:hypothetical protein